MREEFLNQIHGRLDFFKQQDHAHSSPEICEILAKYLESAIADWAMEL
jgi:hypothetical protein